MGLDLNMNAITISTDMGGISGTVSVPPKHGTSLLRTEETKMTRTMNRNVPVSTNRDLMVSPEIKAILPDVLIEYLWQLVLNGKWTTSEKQSFMLQPGKLSGRDIQEIYHTCGNRNSQDVRRVYGVNSMNCVLQVLHSGDDYQMQLCENI